VHLHDPFGAAFEGDRLVENLLDAVDPLGQALDAGDEVEHVGRRCGDGDSDGIVAFYGVTPPPACG